MTPKESERARGTHFLKGAEEEEAQDAEKCKRARRTHILESAKGVTTQDTKRASEGDPPTGE